MTHQALLILRLIPFASTPSLHELLKRYSPLASTLSEPPDHHKCTCFTSAQADCLQHFHPENAEAKDPIHPVNPVSITQFAPY
jgi:hypothetical protein